MSLFRAIKSELIFPPTIKYRLLSVSPFYIKIKELLNIKDYRFLQASLYFVEFNILIYLYLSFHFLSVCVLCMSMHVWRSEDNRGRGRRELVLFFHHVVSEDGIKIISKIVRLGSKLL